MIDPYDPYVLNLAVAMYLFIAQIYLCVHPGPIKSGILVSLAQGIMSVLFAFNLHIYILFIRNF